MEAGETSQPGATSLPERGVAPASIDQRITAALADAEQPRAFSELRASCRVRTTTLYERLAAMTAEGTIAKSAEGYRSSAADRCSRQALSRNTGR